MLAISSTIRSAAAVIWLSRSCTVCVHPMLLFLQPTVVSEHLQGRIYQSLPGRDLDFICFTRERCAPITQLQHEVMHYQKKSFCWSVTSSRFICWPT